MKTVKKNVYYCDFCKKKSLSATVIHNHEKHCTGNINRECKLCGFDETSHDLPEIVESFKKRFRLVDVLIPGDDYGGEYNEIEVEWTGKPVTLDEIEDAVDSCPACTLAVLRLTGMNRYYFGFEYNYKQDIKNWWEERDNEQTYNFFHSEN